MNGLNILIFNATVWEDRVIDMLAGHRFIVI
jgi:hypothetical protein